MTETLSARRTQTRERLVDAAARVFAEKGVLGASVEEICEAAGFTRGAFYSNFESKDALCLALLQRQADEALTSIRDALGALDEPCGAQPTAASIDEAIDDTVTLFLRLQPSDRTSILASAELRLQAARSASLRPEYQDFERHANETFSQVIGEAAARFGYRLSVPANRAIAVLHGIYEHGSVTSLIDGETGTVEARGQLMSLVLKSCLAPIEGAAECQPAQR